ncbi:ATP-dependent helicase, partial [Listeria monocytogenes]|nr:ATP-dependent helicase [Listeria monocytogenes]
LNLEVYTPLKYVYPSKIEKYTEQATAGASSWANREKGRNQLMITNLLKRAESSIHAFKLTSERILDNISLKLQVIEEYKQSKNGIVKSDSDDFEDDVFTVGQDLKIDIADMDYQSWEKQLVADKYVFTELLDVVNRIIPEHDTKMATLQEIILKKIENPINKGNKKVIIFTA